MHTTDTGDRSRALDLLGEFVPRAVLSRARFLAEEIERDEYVRAYIAKRVYLIVVTLLGTVSIGLLAVSGLTQLVRLLGIDPMEHRIIVGLLIGAVMFLVVFAPALFLVWRLEKKALQEMSAGR